jgi:hypothetical protein
VTISLARFAGDGSGENPYRPAGTDDIERWGLIDLRPPGQPDGWCIVGSDTAPRQALTLGDDPDEQHPAGLQVLRNRLGVNLNGGKALGRQILDLLHDHGRNDGKGWRPLQPSNDAWEVWLAGRRIAALPKVSGAAVMVTDDFNRADGAIGSDWTVITGTFTIASNELNINGIGAARHLTDLDHPDMRVSADPNTSTSVGATAWGPIARIDSATDSNGYWSYVRHDAGRLQLFRLDGSLVAPTQTALTSFSNRPTGERIGVQAVGSRISLLVGGVEDIDHIATDTTYPSYLGHGLMGYQAGSISVDDYRAEPLGGIGLVVGFLQLGTR